MKGKVEEFSDQTCAVQQVFGPAIDNRRIVLMETAEQNPRWFGTDGPGDNFPPAFVGFVADLAPVDGDNHNRIVVAQQDDAVSL